MGLNRSNVVLSHRHLDNLGPLAYIAGFEAEDVLVEAGDFEVVGVPLPTGHPMVRARRALGWGLRSVGGVHRRVPRVVVPGSGAAADHVIFMARSPAELALLESCRAVAGSKTVLTVWMIELWQSTLDQWFTSRDGFGFVDNIFVGNPDVVDSVRLMAPQARVEYVPAAVDVLRFAPEDPAGPRPVSILQLGRRDEMQHRLLLDIARQRRMHYHYDTTDGEAVDWVEHRDAVADLYKLASVAICNYAKHDMPEVIGPRRVMSSRLFEGLAAGTILLGHPPVDQSEEELFGRTVVHQIQPDNLERQLDELMDPAASAAERVANVQLALRGQDWGHRWQRILGMLDLPVSDALTKRLELLAQRADSLDDLAGRGRASDVSASDAAADAPGAVIGAQRSA